MDPGDLVAGYRIESILGQGGMGVVYEATQLSLNRTVALKILSPQLGRDQLFRERFRREGHIQAAIDHPHIVTVYEAGEIDDSLFLAMRLVRGSTLKDMIIGRDLEGARTLRLLKPIADALDTAHEAGLTHRDIKPQNILVGVRDHAFLADFGLTKSSTETGLTRTGQFVGTIDYISPEQIRGEKAGPASDIYALTAVLYECFCGVVPYPKPSDAAVLYAHISDPSPLVTDQRPELPPALDEVIARGMAKSPSDRPASASEMIAEAERALGKRVRAVITPPGPVEGPEEIGIREEESRISTRESRIREPRSEPRHPAGESAAALDAAAPVDAPEGDASGAETAHATARASEPADRTTVRRREPTIAAAQDENAVRPPVGRSASDNRTVATPPAPFPVTARPREPAASPSRLVAAALLGLIVLGAAGFGLGRAGRDETRATAQPDFVGSASNADVTLELPARWRRAERPPTIPGLDLTSAMTLAAGPRADSGLVVGRAEPGGRDLLPVSLAQAAVPAPGRGAPVRTPHLQGYRHQDLRVRGYPGALDVLATPTSRGTLAFVCFAPAASATVRGECQRVVASARLVDAEPGAVGPSPDYARRLNSVLAMLNREVRSRRLILARAKTRRGQSGAAAGLGRVHEQAARSVRRADPEVAAREANLMIARALGRTAEAYRRLSRGARSGSRSRHERARSAVARAERDTRVAVNELERLGYARPPGN